MEIKAAPPASRCARLLLHLPAHPSLRRAGTAVVGPLRSFKSERGSRGEKGSDKVKLFPELLPPRVVLTHAHPSQRTTHGAQHPTALQLNGMV